MSAPNFSYDRRCVLVSNDDYEAGNVPKIGDVFDNDRSYPSAYLADYKDKFTTIAIVITSGYYADACIDILERDDKADELLKVELAITRNQHMMSFLLAPCRENKHEHECDKYNFFHIVVID